MVSAILAVRGRWVILHQGDFRLLLSLVSHLRRKCHERKRVKNVSPHSTKLTPCPLFELCSERLHCKEVLGGGIGVIKRQLQLATWVMASFKTWAFTGSLLVLLKPNLFSTYFLELTKAVVQLSKGGKKYFFGVHKKITFYCVHFVSIPWVLAPKSFPVKNFRTRSVSPKSSLLQKKTTVCFFAQQITQFPFSLEFRGVLSTA